MALNQLTDESYSRKSRKRVGRGIGSGTGKTCGSGHKGQKSRSGVSINGFEGGQMPIYMRLPKRGFTNNRREIIGKVNIQDIQVAVDKKSIDAKKEITPEILTSLGLIKKGQKVKLLGKGKITTAVKISVHFISKTAQEAIEQSKGSVTLIAVSQLISSDDSPANEAKKVDNNKNPANKASASKGESK